MDITLIPGRFATVTPSDATALNTSTMLGLFVGTAGDLVVKGVDGVEVTLKATAGQIVPGKFSRVMVATTADDIVSMHTPSTDYVVT